MRKQRSSNIELLRIIAMFLIVIHHTIVHGVLDENTVDFFALSYFSKHVLTVFIIQSMVILGKMGVAIFIIITGYFMVYSTARLAKLIKVWLPIFFYSVVLFLFCVAIGQQPFSIEASIKSAFPVVFNNYWFMTGYIVMYLFIPFINTFLKNATTTQRLLVLGLLFVTNIVVPIIFVAAPSYAAALGANNIVCFVFLYLVGAELRLRSILQKKNLKLGRMIFWGSFTGYIASVGCLDLIGLITRQNFFIHHATILSGSGGYGLFALGMAIGFFIMIGNHSIQYQPSINMVAGSTLSVYLIHDNPYIRPWLWHTVFRLDSVSSELWLSAVAKIFVISSLVFIVATLIDLIRRMLFDYAEDHFSRWLASLILQEGSWAKRKLKFILIGRL